MLTPYPAASFPAIGWGGAKSYLGPQGEVYFGPIPLPRALTTEENGAVISGKSAIYLFGEIRYVTLKRQRTTRFRVFYRGSGMVPPAGTALPTVQDNEGNNSD